MNTQDPDYNVDRLTDNEIDMLIDWGKRNPSKARDAFAFNALLKISAVPQPKRKGE